MTDTWPDEMPARKRPLPFNSKEAAKLIAKEAMAGGPLTDFDKQFLGDKASVRVSIPLTDYMETRRLLLLLRDKIEPLLANADRLAGERTKLLHIQWELQTLSRKMNAYRKR